MMGKKDVKNANSSILSTRAAARLCGVHDSTVVRWVEKGLLAAFKTPGGHRRIFRGDLADFMRRYGLPIVGEAA
jgi:excisionase family DNA binding protein